MNRVRVIILVMTLFLALPGILLLLLTNPVCSIAYTPPSGDSAHTGNLRAHVYTLAEQMPPRNYRNPQVLDACADYIRRHFTHSGGRVTDQEYEARGIAYRNVICSFGPPDAGRIIVGAHYDVCEDQPGADDNASGVAGLLELARLLSPQADSLKYRIDLVAYTLEESPFFRTELMGSAVHARSLYEASVKVREMICLEMIGYFSEEENSQSYPVEAMQLLYPSRGNFIAIVGNMSNMEQVRRCKVHMLAGARLDVQSINAPADVPGLDFSDHLNYWKYEYPALMITNTAFYRNKNYHEPTDTPETLDFEKMGQVVQGVFTHLMRSQDE